MLKATPSFSKIIAGIDPEALNARASAGDAPKVRPKLNAHVHLPPNFTAFDTTRQALDLAAAQGVGVLGASNYYDYSIYKEFGDLAAERGVFPLFGLEIIALIDDLVAAGVKINDPGNPGKMYICGKGITRFDPMTDEAAKLLDVIRSNDSARMAAIVEKLSKVLQHSGIDTGLTVDAVIGRIVARHHCDRATVYLQERHIAQAFQEVLFDLIDESDRQVSFERAFGAAPKDIRSGVTVQNEIRGHLLKAGKPAFVPDTFVDFDHAYRLVLALGGIPCYPVLADGASPICPYEEPVERLIADLKTRGVYAVEFVPVRNTLDVLERYVCALRDAGLIVTAGTEHNTRDLIPIEPTCLGGEAISDDIKDIFWEGACVVAAHQYLTMHDLPGYVDNHGHLNASIPDSRRIDTFSRQGAALIAMYQEHTGATD